MRLAIRPSAIPIHRVILRRLAVAWIALSLLFGGVAYVVELNRIDDFVVALAASESARFNSLGMPEGPPEDAMAALALQEKAREYAGQHFVFTQIYDRRLQKLVETVNPQHAELAAEAKAHSHPFPADARHHFARINVLQTTLVQIRVPLRDPRGQVAGYFDGIFVVDPATVDRLRSDLVQALAITLFAVLLTTVALYPVIISLNRRMIAFSHAVVQGNLDIVALLGAAIALRDSDTNAHNYRVTLYATSLGEALHLDAAAMRALFLGAFLHDIGKIGIRDNILLKPGKLTDEEFGVMKSHVDLGVAILRQADWLQAAIEVVGNHHEKYDGSGYPRGLTGNAIPLNARIFAIVDVFDALASARPYKEAMGCAAALDAVARGAGTHFDPTLARRFLAIAPRLYERYADAGEAELNRLLHEQGARYFFAAAQLKPA
jgi:putative nucleotidyltransferase with HDIG domain